ARRFVLVGCVPRGLLLIQVLRARGCGAIDAVDVDAGRRELAVRVGAARALPDVPAEAGVRVLEASGGAGTVAAAIRAVRKGGAVTLVGNLAPEVPLPL